MAKRTLDYEEEQKILARKFAVLRRAASGVPETLDWIASKELIVVRCIEKRLPKKAIQSIHSELRVWVRDGVFHSVSKKKLLAGLADIDEKRV